MKEGGFTVADWAILLVVLCVLAGIVISKLASYDKPPSRYSVVCLSNADTLFVSDSVSSYTAPSSGGLFGGTLDWDFRVMDNGTRTKVRVTGSCVVR